MSSGHSIADASQMGWGRGWGRKLEKKGKRERENKRTLHSRSNILSLKRISCSYVPPVQTCWLFKRTFCSNVIPVNRLNVPSVQTYLPFEPFKRTVLYNVPPVQTYLPFVQTYLPFEPFKRTVLYNVPPVQTSLSFKRISRSFKCTSRSNVPLVKGTSRSNRFNVPYFTTYLPFKRPSRLKVPPVRTVLTNRTLQRTFRSNVPLV